MSRIIYILLGSLALIVVVGLLIKQVLKRKLDNIDGLVGITKRGDGSKVLGVIGGANPSMGNVEAAAAEKDWQSEDK